ncbi:hypothetical protein C923_05656 [Plasmodium falciparum UGT5.1]|uniref:Uncharacterized protein n=3 Tax=Plasmodium falciparum TaxID=5833 RepID=A0A024X016_PLAFC|nr:hypothetical protein PFFVO_05164 [Plasmodium falciparum Vietnam Oak-Knoll (FVO)]ETW58508.1 hypothetical protein PFMC_05608 [Plasmodium falciparum CAMP/Malaysia]EWC73671.1 hypothetical protein C923_05656 [Plasmodium falciparum UGT5.1]
MISFKNYKYIIIKYIHIYIYNTSINSYKFRKTEFYKFIIFFALLQVEKKCFTIITNNAKQFFLYVKNQ